MPPKVNKKSNQKRSFGRWLGPSRFRGSKVRHQNKMEEPLAIFPGLVVLRGARSKLDYTESWKCEGCNVANEPTKHLLFDLPAFYCSKCQRRGHVDFDVCYDDILLDDSVNLIKKIKFQSKGHCMAFAWSGAIELVNKIWAVLMGKSTKIELQESDLLDKVANERREIKESNKRVPKASRVDIGSSRYSNKMSTIYGRVAEKYGVRSKEADENVRYATYKIGGSIAIPADDFPKICAAIADGSPVVAIINAGKSFWKLKFGQVYKAPSDQKFKRKGCRYIETHAIVLIGAGRSKAMDHFHFLNAYGGRFCSRVTTEGKIIRGGIGKVRASDVHPDPIRLNPVADIDKQGDRGKERAILQCDPLSSSGNDAQNEKFGTEAVECLAGWIKTLWSRKEYSVLHIGIGNGLFLQQLAKQGHAEFSNLTGTDCEVAIENARNLANQNGFEDINFLVDDVFFFRDILKR